jgi:DNA-binding transcriptional LysR family regulator
MEIRRLKHLVALADSRNFSRAAQICHLSQPAFSRSIQSAEEELGLQLFNRGSLEVTCTDAGNFVVERARKLVFDSRCLERDVSMYRERLIGDVALGSGPYPAATMVPALLTEMRSRFPGVNVRVEVNNASYLAEHLRAEELDFYLADLRNVPEAADLTINRIGQLSASFFVRAGHPLLKIPSIQAPVLLPYGLASVRLPDPMLLLLAPLMGLPDGSRLPLAVECDDLNILKSVAMTTDTVLGCADAGTVQEVADGRLLRINVEGLPPFFSDLGVVSLKGRSFSPMAQFAVDSLAKLARVAS